MAVKLFEEQTTNDNGTAVLIENTFNFAKYYTLIAWGTWDSGTAKLQISPNGTDWQDYGTDATFTSDGWYEIRLNPGISIRGVTSGGGVSMDLNLFLF